MAYTILLVLLFCGLLLNKKKKIGLYASAIYILVIGTFRSNSVGTDVRLYGMNFYYTNFNPKSWNMGTDFEIGFNYLIASFKSLISDDYMFFVSVLFIYTFGLTAWFVKKYSPNISLSLLLIVLFGTMFVEFSAMRQFFALATALPFIDKYFKDKNTIFYIISIILIGVLFHHSVIILAFIPLVVDKSFISKKIILLSLGGSYILAFVFQNVLANSLSSFSFLLNERYNTYATELAEAKEGNMALFQTLIAAVIVWYSKNINNRILPIYVLGICCFNIFSSFSDVAPRAAMNLINVFMTIQAAVTVMEQKKVKRFVVGTFVIAAGLVYYFWCYYINGVYNVVPFSFRDL